MFASIPAGSKVRFEVLLDNLTSPVLAEAGFHGDELQVIATLKSGKEMVFTLDTQVGLHNTSRFGSGAPQQQREAA